MRRLGTPGVGLLALVVCVAGSGMTLSSPSSPSNHSTTAVAHQQFIDPPWLQPIELVSVITSNPTAPLLQTTKPPLPAASPRLTVTPTQAAPRTYTVTAGDSLWVIARRHKVSIYNLAADNRMNLYDVLMVGRVLRLPSMGEPSHPPMPYQAPYQAPAVEVRSTGVVAPAAVVPSVGGGGWSGPWACIARYESGGNPAENTGNGYWGGLQFAPSTWWNAAAKLGITVPAYDASIAQQEAVANLVLASGGWGQWPNTSRMCGY